MGTDTKTVPKDILTAFAVLGLAWLDRLPTVDDAVHKAVAPHLVLGNDGVWRPVDFEAWVCYPNGLSLTEALGLTLVWGYHEAVRRFEAETGHSHVAPVVQRARGVESFMPIEPEHNWHIIDDETALRLATAWLTIRRAMRPPVPWGPRDPVAEELQRVIRAASARLSPARVEQLRPAVNATDLGRDWGSRYYRGES